MARFYLDHNVSRRLVRLLREHDHDVITTAELGSERASDGLHLLSASSLDRVLVTHNERDFLMLHDAWLRWRRAWHVTAAHAGIIVLPQVQQWNPMRSVGELEALAEPSDTPRIGSALRNQLWTWRPVEHWIEFARLEGWRSDVIP